MNQDYLGLSVTIKSDLYRYGNHLSIRSLYYTYRRHRMFKFVFWYRIARHYNIYAKSFFFSAIARWYYHQLCLKYSIDFPISVEVGLALKINHGMGLVVNSRAIIGDNVDLSHNVTIATEKGYSPIIGDRVRISPGAVLVGGVTIGNNVVIGANCVVTKDVPNDHVAVGVPNRNLDRPFDEFHDRHYFERVSR